MIKKILSLSTFTMLLLFSECKKGPDDPLISLRTRKARVVGDWKLSSGTDTYEESSSGGHEGKNTTTYDGSTYTTVSETTYGTNSSQDTETGTFVLKMSFKKDGKFEMEETRDGIVSITKGTWNFTGKIGKSKNKEQIVLHYTSSVDPSNSNNSSGNTTDKLFNIKELRNKKMVLVSEQGNEDIQASGNNPTTNTSSSKTEYVLKQ